MRYGTRSNHRRCWTPQGHRPICKTKIGYEWGYLYVALCPFSGDVFAMILTHLNKICFNVFLTEFESHLKTEQILGENQHVLLIGDGATAHQSSLVEQYALKWKKLPTACPELNPVERFFQEIRKLTANQIFEDLKQIETKITEITKQFIENPKAVVKLTAYPYIVPREK